MTQPMDGLFLAPMDTLFTVHLFFILRLMDLDRHHLPKKNTKENHPTGVRTPLFRSVEDVALVIFEGNLRSLYPSS